MTRGAWVEACLTVAMGVEPRRGATYWVEYGPATMKHHMYLCPTLTACTRPLDQTRLLSVTLWSGGLSCPAGDGSHVADSVVVVEGASGRLQHKHHITAGRHVADIYIHSSWWPDGDVTEYWASMRSSNWSLTGTSDVKQIKNTVNRLDFIFVHQNDTNRVKKDSTSNIWFNAP